jgi:hypothetical protein
MGIPGFVIYLIRNSGIAHGEVGLACRQSFELGTGNEPHLGQCCRFLPQRLVSILLSFGLGDL